MKKFVGRQDFLDAVDRIIGGLEKKTKVMTADEKRTIALARSRSCHHHGSANTPTHLSK
jgi:ATP-dependent Zn protease